MAFGLNRKKAVASVHLRMPRDEMAEVEKLAAERGMSVSAEIRFLLKLGMKYLPQLPQL